MGAAFAILGQLVRAGTIGLRYIVRGGRGGRVYADDLVTEGIYSHCRNPMYVGNILIVIGVALASNSLTTLLVALPLVVLAYAAIIAAEEQFLRDKFGAGFEDYCRDVPRWLPRFKGLGTTLSQSQFHWRRLLVKEYGTPFGWIGVLILATLYNLSRDGWTPEELAHRNVIAASPRGRGGALAHCLGPQEDPHRGGRLMRGQRKIARPVPIARVEPAAPVLSAAAALDLGCLREELDTINQELLALLERRGRIVHQVMQIKRECALPAHDPERERRMVEALLSSASDVYPRAALERVFATIFEVSRALISSPTAK